MIKKKIRKTIIIAEAGVNHNGNIKIAKKLIDVAAAWGADQCCRRAPQCRRSEFSPSGPR